MAKQSIYCMLALTSFLLCSSVSISQSRSCWSIPFKVTDRWIMLKGSVGKMDGLTFQIDTGSTCSLIDSKIAGKLGWQPGSDEYRLNAFGQVSQARKVEVPALQMGQVSTSLRCIEADLSTLAVDGVIGLDVLRRMDHLVDIETGKAPARKNLTIDFGARKIRFGKSMDLDHVLALEPDSHQIVVTAGIQGRRKRLALDTGTRVSVLYAGSQQDWIDALPIIGYMTGSRLMGKYQQKEVLLRSFLLGTTRCNDMSAIVSEARNLPVDGLLSVVQLGPKIIHLDFDRNLMTWKE
jgi:hypothetical protein